MRPVLLRNGLDVPIAYLVLAAADQRQFEGAWPSTVRVAPARVLGTV
jgi:hypothetical protein